MRFESLLAIQRFNQGGTVSRGHTPHTYGQLSIVIVIGLEFSCKCSGGNFQMCFKIPIIRGVPFFSENNRHLNSNH